MARPLRYHKFAIHYRRRQLSDEGCGVAIKSSAPVISRTGQEIPPLVRGWYLRRHAEPL